MNKYESVLMDLANIIYPDNPSDCMRKKSKKQYLRVVIFKKLYIELAQVEDKEAKIEYWKVNINPIEVH